MSVENRRFTRVEFSVPAVITVGSTVFSVKEINNLSIGGVLIPCEYEFDLLTKCLLQIPLRDGDEITSPCRRSDLGQF